MTDHTHPKSREHESSVEGIILEGAEGDDESHRRRRTQARAHGASALSFEELVELWHHQHNVALHKERLYIPSCLALLVGTLLGWDKLPLLAVILAGLLSVGLYWYLVVIVADFAKRQDRFYLKMHELRPEILDIMFKSSAALLKGEEDFKSPPTVQRQIRPLSFTVLIVVWAGLIWLKSLTP